MAWGELLDYRDAATAVRGALRGHDVFEFKFDASQFYDAARNLSAAADQVPYALSRALNDAGVDTQNLLIQSTWPRSVQVRNPTFMRAALRHKAAMKHNLAFEIYDALGRASLALHAKGGTKTPRGAHFAIPVGATRGAHGVAKRDRPAALIARTPARELRITGSGIFTGSGGRLKLRYVLKASTPQPADVPFHQDFEYSMRQGLRTGFPLRIRQAMQTRR